jgi:hypothetical protein
MPFHTFNFDIQFYIDENCKITNKIQKIKLVNNEDVIETFEKIDDVKIFLLNKINECKIGNAELAKHVDMNLYNMNSSIRPPSPKSSTRPSSAKQSAKQFFARPQYPKPFEDEIYSHNMNLSRRPQSQYGNTNEDIYPINSNPRRPDVLFKKKQSNPSRINLDTINHDTYNGDQHSMYDDEGNPDSDHLDKLDPKEIMNKYNDLNYDDFNAKTKLKGGSNNGLIFKKKNDNNNTVKFNKSKKGTRKSSLDPDNSDI